MDVHCVGSECQEVFEVADLAPRLGREEPVEKALAEVACPTCGTPNRIPWPKGEAAFVLLS